MFKNMVIRVSKIPETLSDVIDYKTFLPVGVGVLPGLLDTSPRARGRVSLVETAKEGFGRDEATPMSTSSIGSSMTGSLLEATLEDEILITVLIGTGKSNQQRNLNM
jgi:hypothetical protein